MPVDIQLTLTPAQAADSTVYVPAAARRAGVPASRVALARIVRRSIDARGRTVRVNITVQLFMEGEPAPPPVRFDYPDVSNGTDVVVVGSGPAGLFCALRLIELGLRPTVLERGREVAARKADIARINRNGAVDPDSNYAFGEGGAGTFSDGKLFTRSVKRGDCNRALQTLVFHGADPAILCDAHPHIGTDKLPRIMSNIRATILAAGGSVVFGAKMTDLIIKEGRATGVVCGGDRFAGAAVVLATGHSARDVYEILHRRGVRIEAKPYAVGVRAEHPQELIDAIQYHLPARGGGLPAGRGEHLPAATYSLVGQIGGRGVYSFCMCPGGFIVPAMTAAGECVVNGMSPSERNSPFANAAIVTEVRAADFAHLRPEFGELAGLEFQRRLEHAARLHGGRAQVAPAQRLADFVHGKPSQSLPRTSYVPGVAPSDMAAWLPGFVGDALRGGIASFGRRMRGFVTNEALVVGVESRTSTPVRIPRDAATLQHVAVRGLYPAGEGAGYSGGIISSALDGHRIAEAIAAALRV